MERGFVSVAVLANMTVLANIDSLCPSPYWLEPLVVHFLCKRSPFTGRYFSVCFTHWAQGSRVTQGWVVMDPGGADANGAEGGASVWPIPLMALPI